MSNRSDRRKQTQKEQREARKIGTLHPRGLARSVAKYLGADKDTWRQQVAALPKTGRKRIYPKIQRNVEGV